MSDYIYKDPIKDLGMRRIKVPRFVLAKVYKNRTDYKFSIYRFIFKKNLYFINSDNSQIIEETLFRWYTPFVAYLLFPLFLIMHGITNVKEINKEILDLMFQRSRGHYHKEVFTKFSNNSGYYAILDHLGIEYEKIATN